MQYNRFILINNVFHPRLLHRASVGFGRQELFCYFCGEMIHLFNPDNDLALASNLERFTPPKGAVAIRLAGAFLPMFWAEKDDLILAHTEIDSTMSHFRDKYNLHGTASSIVPNGQQTSPWGWSLHTRNMLIRAGADPSCLPDDETLNRYRQLSHRRTSIKINRALGVKEELLAVEAATIEEAREAIARMGDTVIKLPWSSSGRGVIYSSQNSSYNLDNYIRGMIANQGSVTIERKLERLQDFATLFYSDGANVEFRGLSMFVSNNAGFYEGNIVAPQTLLAQRLGIDITSEVKELEKVLTQLVAPHYTGWLGIDMMIHRDKSGLVDIAPCIEMNLRMTMGVAAMAAAEKVYPVEKVPMLLKVTHTSVSLTRL